jgi:hypothetical protein
MVDTNSIELSGREENRGYHDIQYNDTQHSDTQYNETQHNNPQKNGTPNNDIQHYGSQEKVLIRDTQYYDIQNK